MKYPIKKMIKKIPFLLAFSFLIGGYIVAIYTVAKEHRSCACKESVPTPKEIRAVLNFSTPVVIKRIHERNITAPAFQCNSTYSTEVEISFLIAYSGTPARKLIELTVLSFMVQLLKTKGMEIVVVGTGPNIDRELCDLDLDLRYIHYNSGFVDNIGAWKMGLEETRGNWVLHAIEGDYYTPSWMNKFFDDLGLGKFSVVHMNYLPRGDKYRTHRCYMDALGACERGALVMKKDVIRAHPIPSEENKSDDVIIKEYYRTIYTSLEFAEIGEMGTLFPTDSTGPHKRPNVYHLFVNNAVLPPNIPSFISAKPFISFAIATGDERINNLRLALLSVQLQDFGDWEVIIVQTSAGRERKEKDALYRKYFFDDPRIRFLISEDNAAYGHSCRQVAMQESRGKFVILSNDDNYHAPILFSELKKHHENFPNITMFIYDMIHNHSPFNYMWVPSTLEKNRVDMAQVAVEGNLARSIGFPFREFAADNTYFAHCHQKTGRNNLLHIAPHSILFSHN